jgi:SET domain
VVGPVRFLNHACDSNESLIPGAPTGIIVVAKRIIHPGEEVTVHYARECFGERCQCESCKEGLSEERGGNPEVEDGGTQLEAMGLQSKGEKGGPERTRMSTKTQALMSLVVHSEPFAWNASSSRLRELP